MPEANAAGELDQSALGDKDKPAEKKPDPKPPEGAAAGGASAGGAGKGEVEDSIEEGVYKDKDGKKFIKLSMDQFKARVSKSTKKELKEIFGTSDKAAILAIKKQTDDWTKDAEERKRAEMSERQKLEADRDAALSAQQIAERRADRHRDALRVQKTERKVRQVARDHVSGEKLDIALAMFRTELIGMSRRRADKMIGKEGEWFASFVEKNPEFARGGSTTTSTEVKTEKKPATNSLDPNKKAPPEPKPSGEQGKKKTKDMSPAELRAYAAENGIKLPSDLKFIGDVKGAPSTMTDRRAG